MASLKRQLENPSVNFKPHKYQCIIFDENVLFEAINQLELKHFVEKKMVTFILYNWKNERMNDLFEQLKNEVLSASVQKEEKYSAFCDGDDTLLQAISYCMSNLNLSCSPVMSQITEELIMEGYRFRRFRAKLFKDAILYLEFIKTKNIKTFILSRKSKSQLVQLMKYVAGFDIPFFECLQKQGEDIESCFQDFPEPGNAVFISDNQITAAEAAMKMGLKAIIIDRDGTSHDSEVLVIHDLEELIPEEKKRCKQSFDLNINYTDEDFKEIIDYSSYVSKYSKIIMEKHPEITTDKLEGLLQEEFEKFFNHPRFSQEHNQLSALLALQTVRTHYQFREVHDRLDLLSQEVTKSRDELKAIRERRKNLARRHTVPPKEATVN